MLGVAAEAIDADMEARIWKSAVKIMSEPRLHCVVSTTCVGEVEVLKQMSALVFAPKKVEIDAALAVIKGGHEVSNAHASALALGADDETRAAHKDSAAKLTTLGM